MNKASSILKVVLTVILVLLCPIVSLYLILLLAFSGFWEVTIWASLLILPLAIALIWVKRKKLFLIGCGIYLLIFAVLVCTQIGIDRYNESITIDVSPSINTYEYLPFKQDSKIVKLDSELLDFSELSKEQLPIIDGAAAAFPVYSAFVHAVYPHTTEFNDGVFEYNNTVEGYRQLAEKKTDIFIGAAPSADQVSYAQDRGTTFSYTQIGYEAFVFFVHRDNPIESLTAEQIKGIYSGKITNWSQVGGRDEPIVPFQRNPGSGSQSMLIRFMGDTPILEPDMQTQVGGMGEIIEEVADYKNKSSSIGFSFRFYVEGIIQNPDIKLIAIDGVAPTVENIRSGSYGIIAPVYAMTYEDNPNKNVRKLIDWMLSEEGQYIIEQTGYVSMGPSAP